MRQRERLTGVAIGVIVLSSWACGARTSPLEDEGPVDASPGDTRTDTRSDPDTSPPPPTTCTPVTPVSDPIVPPRACEVSFGACRRTVESQLLVPAACGQLPVGAFSGAALLVAYDATGDSGSHGINLALVGLDGSVRRDSEIIADHLAGRAPGLAWHARQETGIVTGTTALVWVDPRGLPVGEQVPLDRDPNEESVQVALEHDGFLLVAVDEGQPFLARLGAFPVEPDWMLFGGTGTRDSTMVVDLDGSAVSAAFLGRGPREIDVFEFTGGPIRRIRTETDIGAVVASIARGDRTFIGHITDTEPGDPIGGIFLSELGAPGLARIATERSGADFLQLGDTIVMAIPVLDEGELRIGLFPHRPELPDRLGERRFTSGRGIRPRQPDLVRVPNGFALLYYIGETGIAVDVFECCVGG